MEALLPKREAELRIRAFPSRAWERGVRGASMNEAIGLARDIFGGVPAIVACLVSFAAVWLLRVALPAATFDRMSLAAGASLGFFAGYVAVREEWAALVPEQPWQWLPYLGLTTAALAVVPGDRRR